MNALLVNIMSKIDKPTKRIRAASRQLLSREWTVRNDLLRLSENAPTCYLDFGRRISIILNEFRSSRPACLNSPTSAYFYGRTNWTDPIRGTASDQFRRISGSYIHFGLIPKCTIRSRGVLPTLPRKPCRSTMRTLAVGINHTFVGVGVRKAGLKYSIIYMNDNATCDISQVPSQDSNEEEEMETVLKQIYDGYEKGEDYHEADNLIADDVKNFSL
ncbi:hypothetical protein EVAR_33784_1 [Eumeta japonica]|uniref:Uncharacterized protein n=1 Tax=Eumeta variegata TaxID=151549 RepID=A0A4C1VU02_EUMVA|nr:hypothetical protein EVAR_33784_1 [Eumeta japonica]